MGSATQTGGYRGGEPAKTFPPPQNKNKKRRNAIEHALFLGLGSGPECTGSTTIVLAEGAASTFNIYVGPTITPH